MTFGHLGFSCFGAQMTGFSKKYPSRGIFSLMSTTNTVQLTFNNIGFETFQKVHHFLTFSWANTNSTRVGFPLKNVGTLSS